MPRELDTLVDFLKNKNLKLTRQRQEILDIFISANRHFSVEDLYNVVKRNDESIGMATVFRTLKLFCEAGIAERIDLEDGRVRYEQKYGHKHHDHLVCTECGEFIETVDLKIEKLQNELCRKLKFTPSRHKMDIFGVCRRCVAKRK